MVHWPNAVIVSWNLAAGICGYSSSSCAVDSSHCARTCSLLVAVDSAYASHLSLITPFTVGITMPSISLASAPKLRIPPTENVNN
jgi:hypothetical protein